MLNVVDSKHVEQKNKRDDNYVNGNFGDVFLNVLISTRSEFTVGPV